MPQEAWRGKVAYLQVAEITPLLPLVKGDFRNFHSSSCLRVAQKYPIAHRSKPARVGKKSLGLWAKVLFERDREEKIQPVYLRSRDGP